jgi:regulator of protease activity HflC (stomatin/prohibitin superfamily)
LGAIAVAHNHSNGLGWIVLASGVAAMAAALFMRSTFLGRLLAFGLVSIAIYTAEAWWLDSAQPETSASLAILQFDGGDAAATQLRQYETFRGTVHLIAGGLVLLTACLCFGSYARAGMDRIKTRYSRTIALAGILTLTGISTGCLKPYDKPEYVEIDTSETGFLIPLEGDGGQQAKFQSEDYLKQRKVATKRVQIAHRWSQEGRFVSEGRWIPMVRLVKVNRSPITRLWDTQLPPGATVVTRNDKAIWIESGDSVGFSMGFNCTAFIAEDDAARFLYWYPSGSLATVMDSEVRGRIQQVAAEVAARYPLDSLRTRKQEIADAVKNDVTNFFTTRGVSVTTVGMFGGMTYENPEIQKSIDQTFIAQQLKVVSEAKFEAQKKENERIELEANANAEKARREAMGQADARKTIAVAEAESIREVNKALNEAQQNPVLYQLKALEVEKARVEKWDGRYPSWYMGGGTTAPGLLLQVPAPGGPQASK